MGVASTSMSGEEPAAASSWGAWMAAAQDGDQDAYERLLRAVLPPLRGFVANRLGDPSGVEDVCQTILLSLHRARHTYRPERRFEPWFWTIARNAVIDAQRARNTRRLRDAPLADDEVAISAEQAVAAGMELTLGLTRALASLPPAQRAARVGVTPGALKGRAHRGDRALRTILAELPD